MSLNIDHTNDTITTTSGTTTIDGPTVPANKTGNVSSYAMSTGTATAAYYALLETFSLPATSNVAANQVLLLTPKATSGSYSPVIVKITMLQGASGLSASSTIQVVSSDETAIAHNDLFLTTATATNGTDITLYMQSVIAASYDVQLISESLDTGISTIWNDGATWSATNPTSGAATSVTSDWAGSGELTSTSFSNGWAGTAYYEKRADGTMLVYFSMSTVGTTTDGTLIFTMPAGYRPNYTVYIPLIGVAATGGAIGYLVIASNGNVTVSAFDTGAVTPNSGVGVYVARN